MSLKSALNATARCVALVAVLGFGLGATARAGSIPFTFSSSITPSSYGSGNTTLSYAGHASDGSHNASSPGTDIQVGTLAVNSTTPTSGSDVVNSTVVISVTLKDTASGLTG
ncbi:MAG: hypothetical protein KGM43_17675, partial [Planctomycetota bacterium]|nr:hypothetical protein [Planctomycetota bacterium]